MHSARPFLSCASRLRGRSLFVFSALLALVAFSVACSQPERVAQTQEEAQPVATQPVATIAPDKSASDTPAETQPATEKSGSPRAVVAPLPEGLITASRAIVLPEPEGLQVGVLVPLAGRSSALGNALLDAIGLAVADHGAGISEPLRFLVFDSGETGETAKAAAEQAVAAGVGLVLGPLYAAQAEAAGAVLSPHGISLLTFSNDLRVARQGIFVLGRTPQSQIATLVARAEAEGLYRFAVFSAGDDLGRVVRDTLQAFAAENRLALVAQGSHSVSDPIASTAVRSFLQNARTYDFLLLTADGRSLAGIANSFAFHDPKFDAVRLATFAGGGESSLRAEPALHGSWFAAPPAPLMERFSVRFEQLLGYLPPALAGTAYDAGAVAVLLHRAYQEEQKNNKAGQARSPWGVAALTRPQGFSGVAGLFRLRRDGGNERALAVYEVTPKGNRLLAPPPLKFGDQAN